MTSVGCRDAFFGFMHIQLFFVAILLLQQIKRANQQEDELLLVQIVLEFIAVI